MASTEDNKTSDEIIKELFSSLNAQPPSPASPPAKSEALIHPLKEVAGTVAQSRLNGNTSIATKRIQAMNKSEIVSVSSVSIGFSKSKPVNVADLNTSLSYADSDITIIQEHLVGKVVKPVVANSALLQKLLLADTNASLQTRKDRNPISSVAKKKRKHSPDRKNKSHKKKHKKYDVKLPHTRQLTARKSTSPQNKRVRSVSHDRQQSYKYRRSSSKTRQETMFRTKEKTLATSKCDRRSGSNLKKRWSTKSRSISREQNRNDLPSAVRSRNETSTHRQYRSRSPVRDRLLKLYSKKLSRSPEHIKKDPFDEWKCKMKKIPEISIIESGESSSPKKVSSSKLCIDLEDKSNYNYEPLKIDAIPMPDQLKNEAALDKIPPTRETSVRDSISGTASLNNITLPPCKKGSIMPVCDVESQFPNQLPCFDSQDGASLCLANFDIPLPPIPPSCAPPKTEYISTYPPPNPSKFKRRNSLKSNLNTVKESTSNVSSSIVDTQTALTCSVTAPSGKAEITLPNKNESCCSQNIIPTYPKLSPAATPLIDNNSSDGQTSTAQITNLPSLRAGHQSCTSSTTFAYSNLHNQLKNPCSSYLEFTANTENVVIGENETACVPSPEAHLKSISSHPSPTPYFVNPGDKKMFHHSLPLVTPCLPKGSSATVKFCVRSPNQKFPNSLESSENQLPSVPSKSEQDEYPSDNCSSQITSLMRASVTNDSIAEDTLQFAVASSLTNHSLINQLQMTSLPQSQATSSQLPRVINASLPSNPLSSKNIPSPKFPCPPSILNKPPLTESPTILLPSTCFVQSLSNLLPVCENGPAQTNFAPSQAINNNSTNILTPHITFGMLPLTTTPHLPTLRSTTTIQLSPSNTTTDLSMISRTVQPPPFANTIIDQQQVTRTTQLPSTTTTTAANTTTTITTTTTTTTTTTGLPLPVNDASALPPPSNTLTGAPPPASSPPARSCPTAGGATASGVSLKGSGRTDQAATTISGTAAAGDRSKSKIAGSIRIASLKDSALFLAATEISLKNKEREHTEKSLNTDNEVPTQPKEEDDGLTSNVNSIETEIEHCDDEKFSRKHKKDKKNKKDKEKEPSNLKNTMNKEEKDKHNKEKKKKSTKRHSHSAERRRSQTPSKSKSIKSHDKADKSRDTSTLRDKSSKHTHSKSRSHRSKSRERGSKSKERKRSNSKEKRRSRSKEKRRSQSVEKSSSRKSSDKSRRETFKEKQSSFRDERTSPVKSRQKSNDSSDKQSSRRRSHSSERRRHSRSPGKHSKSSHKKSPTRSKKRNSGDEDDCVKALKDKVTRKRLLEIAKRNAVQMVTSGQLPATYGPVAGGTVPGMYPVQGKSVDDLTAFCKQLAAMGEYSDDEDGRGALVDEDVDSDSGGNEPSKETFTYTGKHPFAVRDRSIMMNIRNAPMLPIKSNAERLVETSKLREQFPVSSGSHHRDKDKEWVPVEPGDGKQRAITAGPSSATEGGESSPAAEADARALDTDKVFAEPEESAINIDLSEIVSERLSAMRKLQENPNDPVAKNKLNTVQKTMSNWALSKQEPGKFTGNTGVKVLSIEELSSGQQAWARKEQLKTAAPVSSHFGLRMLQKMGWNPGEGLGKNKEGSTIPLMLEVKTDKKGFHAQEELTPQKPPIPLTKTLAGEVSRRSLAAAVHQQAIENPIVRFVRTELNAALQQSAFPANTGSARGGRGGGGGGRGRGGGVNRIGGGGNNRGGGGANLASSGRGGSARSVVTPRSSSCGAEDGSEGNDANTPPSLAGAGSCSGGVNPGRLNLGVGFVGADSSNPRFSSRGDRGRNDARGAFIKNNSGRAVDQTGSIGGGGVSFSSFSTSPGPFNLGNTNNLGSLPGLPNDTLPGLLNFLTSLNNGHDLSPLQLAQLRAISQLSGVQAAPVNSSISALTSALYGLAGLANQQQATASSGLLGGRVTSGGQRGSSGGSGTSTIQPLMSLNLLQQQPQPFRANIPSPPWLNSAASASGLPPNLNLFMILDQIIKRIIS